MAVGGVVSSELFLVLQEGATVGPYVTLAATSEAGAVTVNYGIFINALIFFLILVFTLFMVIRSFNRLKKEEEVAPEAPKDPVPNRENILLSEIRYLLREGRS